MGGKGLIDIFLYSYHLPACYCINIAKRNSVLVPQGVKGLITGMTMIMVEGSSTHHDIHVCVLQMPKQMQLKVKRVTKNQHWQAQK